MSSQVSAADQELFLDILTKEEREALLTKKMEEIRKKNEALRKRHEEIEADKKIALEGKAKRPSSPTKEPKTFQSDADTRPADKPRPPKSAGRGKPVDKRKKEKPKSQDKQTVVRSESNEDREIRKEISLVEEWNRAIQKETAIHKTITFTPRFQRPLSGDFDFNRQSTEQTRDNNFSQKGEGQRRGPKDGQQRQNFRESDFSRQQNENQGERNKRYSREFDGDRGGNRHSRDFDSERNNKHTKGFDGENRNRHSRDFEGEGNNRHSRDFEGERNNRHSRDFESERNNRHSRDFESERNNRRSRDFDVEKNGRHSRDFDGEKNNRHSRDFDGERSKRNSRDFEGYRRQNSDQHEYRRQNSDHDGPRRQNSFDKRVQFEDSEYEPRRKRQFGGQTGARSANPRDQRRHEPSANGPPPDPAYNFLSDRGREHSSHQGQPHGQQIQNDPRKDQQSRRHPKNFGGTDFSNVKSKMKVVKERQGRGGPPRSKMEMAIAMTGRERRQYIEWKTERNMVDQARIDRQKSSSGEWRREWDNEKFGNDFDEESARRSEPAKRPAGRIGSGRFDRGDRDERQKGEAMPESSGQKEKHEPRARDGDSNRNSGDWESPPSKPMGRGRGRGRGRGKGESKPQRIRTTSGDDRRVERQHDLLVIKVDNSPGKVSDNTVEVEYSDGEVPVMPQPSTMPHPQTSKTSCAQTSTDELWWDEEADEVALSLMGDSLDGITPEDDIFEPKDLFDDNEQRSLEEDHYGTELHGDEEYEEHEEGQYEDTGSTPRQSQSQGDTDEWEDCPEDEDGSSISSASSPSKSEASLKDPLKINCNLNPDAPEFTPSLSPISPSDKKSPKTSDPSAKSPSSKKSPTKPLPQQPKSTAKKSPSAKDSKPTSKKDVKSPVESKEIATGTDVCDKKQEVVDKKDKADSKEPCQESSGQSSTTSKNEEEVLTASSSNSDVKEVGDTSKTEKEVVDTSSTDKEVVDSSSTDKEEVNTSNADKEEVITSKCEVDETSQAKEEDIPQKAENEAQQKQMASEDTELTETEAEGKPQSVDGIALDQELKEALLSQESGGTVDKAEEDKQEAEEETKQPDVENKSGEEDAAS